MTDREIAALYRADALALEQAAAILGCSRAEGSLNRKVTAFVIGFLNGRAETLRGLASLTQDRPRGTEP